MNNSSSENRPNNAATDGMETGPQRMALPSDADSSGRRLGEEELALLREVIASGTLNCTKGTMVNRLEQEFARRYPAAGGQSAGEQSAAHEWHCVAVTSGTAAIHTAVAALDPEPGDEFITTSVTDMGALTPILYQSAIPVFADIDPHTFNITAESIRRVLSPRTRAIIVTHLFGAPCDMTPILQLAKERSLPVIEDTAQAPFARLNGQRLGTLGDIGCFSLQQGKHMTAGEGGLVITRDAALARRMTLFHDKAWSYGDAQPDHYFLALNYRMSELQGAVALAQLDKVEDVVRDRQQSAALFCRLIADLPGIEPQRVPPGGESVFWKLALRVDERACGADVRQLAAWLRDEFGIASAPRYIQKPAFECEIFRCRRTFGQSQFPWRGAHRDGFAPAAAFPDNADFSGTTDALAHMLVLPWNENYREEHVRFIARALHHAVQHFRA